MQTPTVGGRRRFNPLVLSEIQNAGDNETAAFADHVEEIAIFGRCDINLMFNCT
jgi:hypothetical protein